MEIPQQLLIGGRWRDASDGGTLDVLDPATEEVVATVPRATASDVAAALAAAEAGFQQWRRTSPVERANVLREAARLIRSRQAAIARTLTQEQGKPLAESSAEVAQAADYFEWYAGEAERVYGRVVEVGGRNRARVERRPVGPVAAFTAWNFPAALPARKIAPALAVGCSIVLKPAEEAPRTALALAAACVDAGAPAGVVNVLTGEPSAISTALLASPVIRKLSLTGSVPVGQELVRLSSAHLPSVSLELGGHAPVLVFADADLDAAVEQCVRAKYRNTGQVCISPSRFFVQSEVVAEFTSRFVERVDALRIGPGLEDGVDVGPLSNGRRREAVEKAIADAVSRGAEVRCGGRRPAGFSRGFFYEPTVLTSVPDDAELMSVEPFGPVAPIRPFSTLEEGLALANGVPYGLASYLFTTSLTTAHDAADGLETGMIGVNEVGLAKPALPFGGVKLSGYGREGGIEGTDAYTVPTYVNVRI
ncbi:NAD-dependent succinate-semialdehyde dehydrogenase [Flindersiella endophytica]